MLPPLGSTRVNAEREIAHWTIADSRVQAMLDRKGANDIEPTVKGKKWGRFSMLPTCGDYILCRAPGRRRGKDHKVLCAKLRLRHLVGEANGLQ